MKSCVNCHHPVSGGDRHARFACPPALKGALSNRKKAHSKAKKKAKKERAFLPARGQAVAGTGVPSGAKK
jgi:capsid portal protein